MGSFQALPRERVPPRAGGAWGAGWGRGGGGGGGGERGPRTSPSRVRAAAWRPAQVPPRGVCI